MNIMKKTRSWYFWVKEECDLLTSELTSGKNLDPAAKYFFKAYSLLGILVAILLTFAVLLFGDFGDES